MTHTRRIFRSRAACARSTVHSDLLLEHAWAFELAELTRGLPPLGSWAQVRQRRQDSSDDAKNLESRDTGEAPTEQVAPREASRADKGQRMSSLLLLQTLIAAETLQQIRAVRDNGSEGVVMSLPIEIHPDYSYAGSRRVLRGEFLTTPNEEPRQIVFYLAVHFAQMFGIRLLLLVLMSNHLHHHADDPNGRYPDFIQQFYAWVAIALNQHHFGTIKGTFWGRGKPGRPRCEGKNDTLRKLIYAAVNPVAAGIEPTATRWPGYIFGPEHAGLTLRVRRPTVLDGFPSFPDHHDFTVPVPHDYHDMPAAHVRAHFRRERKKAEKKLRELRGNKPWITTPIALKMVGRKHSRPDPGNDINPLFVALDPERLAAAIARRRKFLADYKDCRKRFLAGDKAVVWPSGTYAMHVRHGQPREASPQRSNWRAPPS